MYTLKETRNYFHSTMQKAMLSAKILAAATFGLSVLTFASSASATSLVPNIEGEIKTDLGCISNTCIDPETLPFAYKVTSLEYDTDGVGPLFGKSLLFSDESSTPDNYGFGIKFDVPDLGTNPPTGKFYFRPVARVDNNTKFGTTFEKGQLEVGRFRFDLSKEVNSVTFDLFDVEDAGKTGILEINGVPLAEAITAAITGNKSRQLITIKNVSSFVIQLGNPGPNSTFQNTGDGVAMRATAVPEPATVISLGALAVAGMFGTRQRRKMGV